MSNIIRSVLQQDVALAPSTTLDPITLPTNPLSHILITLRALNDTASLADYRFLIAFLNFISNLEVQFKGHVIIGGNLRDLAILNAVLTGFRPVQSNALHTNSDTRAVTFMISFSRVPFWREEAFPAVRSGELSLNITSAAAQTGLTGVTIQVETVELIGVTPARFLKYTTQQRTLPSTGNNDIDLPIGNAILGILVFGTTVPTGASFNATAGAMRILIDNVESDYANLNWETAHGEIGRRITSLHDWTGHVHSFVDAAAGEALTRQQQLIAEGMENYAYLDFDPLKDMSYALLTEGKSRVQLRVNADVADLLRIVPVELFNVSGLARAGGAVGR
ncbi:hypothetical protein LCGC14_0989490 [marine sediment metagenome]|uniref:Uncharacterized protein n=1 Tax=marine sediment metagenome TaxID=412755 RepID=A0A0F9N644_9ZZZZ